MTIITKKGNVKYDCIRFEQKGGVFRVAVMNGSNVLVTTKWFGMSDGDAFVLSGIDGKVKIELSRLK